MDLKEEILVYCSKLGITNVGLIKSRRFDELRDFYENRKALNLQNEFEEDDIEKRINPNHYMEEGKTIVSIAFPYLSGEEYKENGFSVYTRGYDYHKVVRGYLDKICDFIISKGGKALAFVDSNTLPERYIAYLSGIGFIGKNNMLITKEYGSYVFLGEIITDLEIYDEDKGDFNSLIDYKECGDCTICYEECPTKSINKNRKNSNICLSYLTQKKDLMDWEMKALDGRIFGCDSCQKECPFNKGRKLSSIESFKPLEFMNDDNLDYIINMGNSDFKESLKNTSCGWRGKNVLKRNAIIRKALYKKENIEDIKSESDYIKKYIDRLL
ncbi:tRNA epoxyqueuosine(34) reductase QueG [Clostridium paraputrificum]|uniref:tRNA epoxyqueuosine(34) reductase QueG n=1 Tax=Clostridium TaxID=1485 RepID=UPI003D342107